MIGNPPFLSQLGVLDRPRRAGGADLRARFGAAVAGYTDPAALFLVLGHRPARPDGGVVAMIEPVSLLTARDAAGARAAVLDGAALTDLWLLGSGVFDASVEVCAPVLVRSSDARSTRLHAGRGGPPAISSMRRAGGSVVVAACWPITPACPGGRSRPRDDRRPGGGDGGLPRPVLRAGPARGRPGRRRRRPAAAAGHHRSDRSGCAGVGRPDDALQQDRLPATRGWTWRRSTRSCGRGRRPGWCPRCCWPPRRGCSRRWSTRPGRLLPSVPLISVVAPVAELWRIAAVLTCPAVAAEAARRHLGSGRNARSMRLRAQEVLELPLPADRERWDAAAARLRTGAPLAEVGRLMDEAYGLTGDEELLDGGSGCAALSRRRRRSGGRSGASPGGGRAASLRAPRP